MGIFSCCTVSDVRPRTEDEYKRPPSGSNAAKTSLPKTVIITVAKKTSEVDSNTLLYSPTLIRSPSSNTAHSLATSTFSTMSPSPLEAKDVRFSSVVTSRAATSRINQDITFIDLPNIRKIIFEYLLTPISQLDRSLAELEDIRTFILHFPEDGYQRLASWLAYRILAGPIGRMSDPDILPSPISCFRYQRVVLQAITSTEAFNLRNFSEIQDKLTLQKNVRAILSDKIVEQLALSNEEQSYQVLAKLIGKSELPIYTNHRDGVLNNALQGQAKLAEVLKGNVLKQVVNNADLIEAIDLQAPIAEQLINAACKVNSIKGLTLLCRSSSNTTADYHPRNKFNQFVQPIAEGFLAHLNDAKKPPMAVTLNSPLWKSVHKRLRKEKSKALIHPAMEWFIASLNLATTLHCDLLSGLKFAGYQLTDLTKEVRIKITCLSLNREARKGILKFSTLKDFIRSFEKLEVLRLADDQILTLPENCNKLRRLILSAKNIYELPPMPQLEHLYLIDSKARFPKDLPNLKVFIGAKSREAFSAPEMPNMPKVEILEIDGYNWDVSDMPRVTRLIVSNNKRVEEIKGNSQLEVLILHNCINLRRLFPQIELQEIAKKLGEIQPHLHFLSARALGNPLIEEYCNEWQSNWMESF